MLMMTSQILKCVDFTKTQKSRYLENETFFLKIKKSLNTHQGLLIAKNNSVAEVTFNKIMIHDPWTCTKSSISVTSPLHLLNVNLWANINKLKAETRVVLNFLGKVTFFKKLFFFLFSVKQLKFFCWCFACQMV